MRQNRFEGLACMTVLLFMISGCAGPISSEVRKEANNNLEFVKVLEKPASFRGTVVIWGGVIIKVVNRSGGSDLFLWETPLDYRGRPGGRENSEGEFIARTSESLDPKIYARDRRITVAGEITSEELGSSNDRPYLYPVINIRESHLWEQNAPAVQLYWGKRPYYWPDEFTSDREYRGPLP